MYPNGSNLCSSFTSTHDSFEIHHAAMQRYKQARKQRQEERERFKQRKLSQSYQDSSSSQPSRTDDTSDSSSSSSSLQPGSSSSLEYASSSRSTDSDSTDVLQSVQSSASEPIASLPRLLRPKTATSPVHKRRNAPRANRSWSEKLHRYQERRDQGEKCLQDLKQHFDQEVTGHGLDEVLRKYEVIARRVGMWEGRIKELESMIEKEKENEP